jgi:protein-L-isoaspartate(D-aspartate) O-methyltransferase
MVDDIIARHGQLGLALSGEVEAAMRAVPRHLFTPNVSPEVAYRNDSVVTKTDQNGTPISTVSAPTIVAMMLDQLQLRPGQRVLEIGRGGYNAALLRELVGPDGSVTTLDIDADVVARAQECLPAAGYHDVQVLHVDAEFGAPQPDPFDRVIVTAGAWDVPPAWTDQLVEGGRLVVPLRTCGLTRSWALEKRGGRLVSDGHIMCGFVPMQGVGEHRGSSLALHGDGVRLWLDEGQPVDSAALTDALSRPRVEAWSGVAVGRREPFDHQDLWLASTLSRFAILTAEPHAIDSGLVLPSWRLGTPTLVEGGTLAYRAKLRPADPEQTSDSDEIRYEFGAYAHGPDAADAAERLAESIRLWDRSRRPKPTMTVVPAGTPDADLPVGLVLDKKHTRIVISWPATTT